MHEQHEVFKAPADGEAKIWRYMDLAKFISLLEYKSLYFARSDLMSDPFEGSVTALTLELSREFLGTAYEKFKSQLSDFRKNFRKHIYLNCWHMSDFESAAMWGLYQTGGHGIAVQSTYKRLSESLRDDRPIYIGMVRYVDFGHDIIDEGNVFYPFVHKRRSFEFEHELRAVVDRPPDKLEDGSVRYGGDSPPAGYNLDCDLDSLVEQVFIAPDAPSWFADLVSRLIVRYERTWKITQSSLSTDPIY